ncbi:MAG TPA: anthranilate phosphoribosyltransferase [Chthoniobacteraceae bacterium]|jgi:anthranilate phosphoribosyltransferase|nr:anthranilate phosphoribosyltransferase [Chthoniobacteraceae bacterium]
MKARSGDVNAAFATAFPVFIIPDTYLIIPSVHSLTLQLRRNEDLESSHIYEAVAALVDTGVPEQEKADFLHALRAKGETAGEIAGFVAALLARSVDPRLDPATLPGPMLDVCGTGGDRMELFNVSTTAMFLLAAGGAVIVKHGNRGISSKSGGADVLEALGVKIEMAPDRLRESIAATGIGFIFAPAYHPSFKVIGPVRKTLAAQGVATIFNILGPLLNPARPPYQLAGIFSETLLPKYAEVLRLLGRECAWAVHGSSGTQGSGVDELSTLGVNHYCEVKNGAISAHNLDPEPLGFSRAEIEELRGGDREENARILTGILAGNIHGPQRDVVLLNAAAGFVVCGLAEDLSAGIALAHEQLASGRALARLKALQAFCADAALGR